MVHTLHFLLERGALDTIDSDEEAFGQQLMVLAIIPAAIDLSQIVVRLLVKVRHVLVPAQRQLTRDLDEAQDRMRLLHRPELRLDEVRVWRADLLGHDDVLLELGLAERDVSALDAV